MLHRLKNSFAAVFLFNFILAALFYLPSIHSKFVYDINMHFVSYDKYGIAGFWTCWNEKTIRWGIHCVNFALWYLFGANDYAWFTAFILLHALTATLLYKVVVYMLERIASSYTYAVAFCSMLLFLLSPYHTETVIWGATIFYLFFAAEFLGIMLCFMRYAEDPKPKYLIILYLLYLHQMLSFEVFFILPVVSVLLYILLRKTGQVTLSVRKLITVFIIPQIAVICFYFLWNKIRIGQIIGHYGVATHFRFDIWMLTANLTKYLLKFGYIHLFFTYAVRDKIAAHLDHHHLLLAIVSVYILTGALAACLFFRRKTTSLWVVIITLFTLFFLTLVPVLNLYLPYNKDIEQERYLYVPAVFFYPFLVLALFTVLRKAAYPIIFIALGISLFFLHRNVGYWEQNAKIFNSLIADYRWPDAKRIFILLDGDTYNGAYMMRDMPESAFAEMLHVQRHIEIADRSYDLLQFNVNSPADSVYHEITDSNTIKLTFAQWGNWYWYKSLGASSYDSTLYKVTIDEWHHSFTAQFKDKRPGDIYIYQAKDKWVEVKGF